MVVCGATGRQGGAVIKKLVRDGRFDVVGLTRDGNSESAAKLRRLGVEVAVADHMGQASLVKAFHGADLVFGVTQPWDTRLRRYDTRKEILQGKNILWASAVAGVSHLVFSSFINPLDERTGVTFIDSKLIIEKLIREQGIPHTIIRSPAFMDDIAIHASGKNFIRHHYDGDTMVPYISLDDFGRLVVNVFSKPERYLNATITTFSDVKTGNEITALLSTIFGKPFFYKSESLWWLRLFQPQILALRHFMEKLAEDDRLHMLHDAFFCNMFPTSEFVTVEDFLQNRMGH